jgi:hypothetical protein
MIFTTKIRENGTTSPMSFEVRYYKLAKKAYPARI